MENIGIYRLNEHARLPERATEYSACFDVFSCIVNGNYIKCYDINNKLNTVYIYKNEITIYPNRRYIIPTGIKMKIPNGYCVRLHPRSGLSIKNGIVLSNMEGIIDSDYFDELFVLITNISYESYSLSHGQKICQCELTKCLDYNFEEIYEDLVQTTNRSGGLGSTGV